MASRSTPGVSRVASQAVSRVASVQSDLGKDGSDTATEADERISTHCRRTSHSSRSSCCWNGSRFSRMDPENNCASWNHGRTCKPLIKYRLIVLPLYRSFFGKHPDRWSGYFDFELADLERPLDHLDLFVSQADRFGQRVLLDPLDFPLPVLLRRV
jgi:hypothetical protein